MNASDEEAVRIRQLSAGDVPLVHDMLTLFAEAFAEPHTYNDARPSDDYLCRILDKQSFIALAATFNNQVIGGIAAYELEKFEQARREIYLYDLAVSSAYRRRGVATALIGELKRIAAERGAWVIFVQADHGDEPAIELYSKLGVREDVLHFDIAPAPKS